MTTDTLADAEIEPRAPDNRVVALAYLVSSYPALSMAWLLREVLELRRLGVRIEVAAVNVPERARHAMTSQEAAEAACAYYLKAHGIHGGIGAHIQTVLRYPRGYLRGLILVLSLGGFDLTRLALNLMYFTEALMVGVWMRRVSLKHLHVHLASQAATVGLYVHRVFGIGYSITVHGPDEFFDVRGQYLEQKLAAAGFVCCISNYARSQTHETWAAFVLEQTTARAPGCGPCPIRTITPPRSRRPNQDPVRGPPHTHEGPAASRRSRRTAGNGRPECAAYPGR